MIALSKNSRLDPTYREKDHSRAQVALTGVAGLIPDSAHLVELEWWREGEQWQLARLRWE